MRYEKGRKDETRQRIVGVASRRLRKDGIGATGIAGLMSDAGLTHGGFYAHFSSKDDLVRSAIHLALRETRDILAAAARKARETKGDGLEAIIAHYLRAAHRDHPETGCAAASLLGELARLPDETRDVLARDMREIILVIAEEISSPTPEIAYATASAIFSLMIGNLQLARGIADERASEAMLAAGRAAAMALARP
jgi:TetR/AcrR family transcriptional regulator, transcriptional repressor for nem operon